LCGQTPFLHTKEKVWDMATEWLVTQASIYSCNPIMMSVIAITKVRLAALAISISTMFHATHTSKHFIQFTSNASSLLSTQTEL